MESDSGGRLGPDGRSSPSARRCWSASVHAAEAGFSRVLLILPVIISIAFFLISDIDSPRRGVIRVVPQNLLALAESLRSP